MISTIAGDNIQDETPNDPVEPERSFKLFYPLPLQPAEPAQLVRGLQLNALKHVVLGGIACYILGRLHAGFYLGLVGIGSCIAAYWIFGTETREGLDWQLEKLEGAKTLYSTRGESVEWLNYILEKLWCSIDPSIFVIVEDILEDTLSSVAPSIIKAVKVTDFDIGVHAPRIHKIRMYKPTPDQPFGEASFSFHADPVASASHARSVKSVPPGIAIRFKTGLNAPIDVKAELTRLHGKLRFKILTAPAFPFISKVAFSFVKVPKINTGVMPLSKHMNVMRLPMMKSLVNEAVKLGFAGFVEPKSMTVDVRELLTTATMDIFAIGVVKVEVRRAERDPNHTNFKDMEDAYVTISMSSHGHKHAPSTRVLKNDINPSWNENLYILVYEEDVVKQDVTVDISVWDADKIKPDDLWGTASTPIREIVNAKVDKLGSLTDWCKHERVIHDGWAALDGKSLEASSMKINYRMTFHPKYLAPKPDSLLARLEKDRSEEEKRLEKEPLQETHKSGILSVQIIEAADLEIADPEMLNDDEFKHPYSPSKVVNPYAVLYLNDNKVFETRAKLRNSSPYWNAMTEHLVKDYDTAFVRISVKTSLDLERDPVLGTRVFYLSEMFEDQQDKYKESERWVALANGIGFGKVLLALKYKPIKMTLSRELRGSDVGTMIIDHARFKDLKPPFSGANIRSTKATLSLNLDPVILKRLKSRDLHSAEVGDDIVWEKRPLYFPLTMRYRTALYVHITQGSIQPVRAIGRVWLKQMSDAAWQEMTIGLYDPPADMNKNEDDWSPDDGPYGQVILRFMIVPGFSPAHSRLRSFRMDMLGADPFRDETLVRKDRQWIQEEEDQAGVSKRHNRSFSQSTEASEEYGDDREEEDEEEAAAAERFIADLKEQRTKSKIPKLFLLRKMSRGTDIIRNKVENVRVGFNSERRASRSVQKE
ncbi:hypothetical protein BX666DRAFT_1848608 [Dichotomocladium elegans]|nr:hypothetical protein BX666DRAFT_1848608 [Dichotomocladium elegans]